MRTRTATAPAWTPGPVGLPRLLAGRADGPASYAEHLATHGPARSWSATRLAELLDEAGLRGRGGAGFPTARKVRAVAAGRGPRIVVANASEGEPASRKDQVLLTTAPHLVLDGLALMATALGAREAVLAVERTRPQALAAAELALAQRRQAGCDAVPIRLAPVPGRYVAGEESALVHLLNGGPAKPTTVPPRPFERGVGGRPTLVQNAETLAHAAMISRHGAEWFRAIGTEAEPGSALVTVSGAVHRPGVSEIALGTPLASLLGAAGGPTTPIGAYLVGGYFGTWVPAEQAAGLELSQADLQRVGARLGCGVIAALPAAVCGVTETARVLRYLAQETAGQCGPCVHGLGAIADTMDALASGRAGTHAPAHLDRWSGMVEGRGACRMPDGAIQLLRSARRAFASEFDLHARGLCSATRREPVLAIPATGRDWGWQ